MCIIRLIVDIPAPSKTYLFSMLEVHKNYLYKSSQKADFILLYKLQLLLCCECKQTSAKVRLKQINYSNFQLLVFHYYV